MKLKLMSLCLALVLMATGTAMLFAGSKNKRGADDMTREQVLKLVRMLVTAETDIRLSEGRFVSLDKLTQQARWQRALTGITLTDNSSGAFNNYKLLVVASGDGQHFQVSVMPQSGCGLSMFSNEAAVIYEGLALGCSNK